MPIPPVQAVGAGLALNGVNDCIDGAREQAEENERDQKAQEGTPPNMPAEYHNQLLDNQK